MPKFDMLNQSGNKVEQLSLSEAVFGIEPNQQVLYDVVNAQRAAMRQGTHDVKNRSEVSGGGRKPWRQKGTGRARQGSTRSPQWRGGGVVFGPTPRSYEVKVNQKVRQLALRSALSAQAQKGQLAIIEDLTLETYKTKELQTILNSLNLKGKTLIITKELTDNIIMASRNIPTVYIEAATHVSVYDILNCKNLVLTKEAVSYFEEVLG
ncbi:MAG: 50S ribosomal protein L4 [Candidatus Phytoplasma sp.]|nr:50S ribosomal protein L4 [Phytoplasma sp.]